LHNSRKRCIGGLGNIIQCHPNSGHWSYLIQMEIGSEPEMGRIGYETTIILFDTSIILTKDYSLVA
jgi:hypothetical protein